MKLEENAFYILGASPRDSAEALRQLAALGSGNIRDLRIRACKTLLDPVRRMEMEAAWLPGADFDLIAGFQRSLAAEPYSAMCDIAMMDHRLCAVARCNALCMALEKYPLSDPSRLAFVLSLFANLYSEPEAEHFIRLLNEDRAAAQFPQIEKKSEIAKIHELLSNRVTRFVDVMEKSLDNLDSADIPRVLRSVNKNCCTDGKTNFKPLLCLLTDRYELHLQKYLGKMAKNADRVLDRLAKLPGAHNAAERKKILAWLESFFINSVFVMSPVALAQPGKVWHERFRLGKKFLTFDRPNGSLCPEAVDEVYAILEKAAAFCKEQPSTDRK